MKLVSGVLVLAVLAALAIVLALSLDPAPPQRQVRSLAPDSLSTPPRQIKLIPMPCPTPRPGLQSNGDFDPNILAPTPSAPFESRMPILGSAQCFSTAPVTP